MPPRAGDEVKSCLAHLGMIALTIIVYTYIYIYPIYISYVHIYIYPIYIYICTYIYIYTYIHTCVYKLVPSLGTTYNGVEGWGGMLTFM